MKTKAVSSQEARRIYKKFTHDINSVYFSIFPAIPALRKTSQKHSNQANEAAIKMLGLMKKSKAGKGKGKGKLQEIELSVAEIKQLLQLAEKDRITTKGESNVLSGLFLLLLAYYESSIKEIASCLMSAYPETINKGKRDSEETLVTVDSVFNSKNLKILKSEIILNKADALCRNPESFSNWLRNNFKIELGVNSDLRNKYLELRTRRNIIVHKNNLITKEYFALAKHNSSLKISKKDIGEKIYINYDYFLASANTIYALGTIVNQNYWKAVAEEDEKEEADNVLNESILELLNDERFYLAEFLLKFAIDNASSEGSKEVFIINLALTFLLTGRQDEAEKMFESFDWNREHRNIEYLFAKHVIYRKNAEVYKLMKKAARKGKKVKDELKGHYRAWPLFSQFRKRKKFKQTFLEIYKEDLL